MVAQIGSVTYLGIEAVEVRVEVHFAQGLPSFQIVGLPNKTVAESRERIRACFHNIGLALPSKKITVNLAPADLDKEGSHFDLPIAMGLLAEMKILPLEEIDNFLYLGELSLDGSINKIIGALPAAITANAGGRGLVCPVENYHEAKISGNQHIIAPAHILELIKYFKDEFEIPTPQNSPYDSVRSNKHLDLKDVKGQAIPKRALEIAAAGGHNLLMIGPPGSGKSMLAKRIVGIMPELQTEEILKSSAIYSIAGCLTEGSIIRERPFREPHCSSSMPAMVGGGKSAKPGEVTLAHNGVLFMDEFPEFSRNTLEALRQPIESGDITISRVNSHITYPAEFQLIAAMNPCRCGYYGSDNQNCSKAPKCVEDYQSKISGPLLDRFDIKVEVSTYNPYLKNSHALNDNPPETSDVVKARVVAARNLQYKRYKEFHANNNDDNSNFSPGASNARGRYSLNDIVSNISMLNRKLDGDALQQAVVLCDKSHKALSQAAQNYKLSMRGIQRILRVARTIADLAQSEAVQYEHLLEALQFRITSYTVGKA